MALELNIQSVLGDMARPNLFEVEIPFLGETFKFHCKAATLPASVVEKTEVGYQNRKIGLAGDRTFEDWTVTVYNDEAQTIREKFIDWSEQQQRHGREIAGNAPEDYKKVGFVKQIARDGETVTTQVKLTGLWPMNVGEIGLDWDSNNEVETFEVNFNVDWWEKLEV